MSNSPSREVELSEGEKGLLLGPSKLIVKEGTVEVFGAPLRRGDELTVVTGRQVPVEPSENSVLSIKLGHGGSFEKVGYELIPEGWTRVVNGLLEMGRAKVMIIGEQDSGKSGLTLYLSNKLTLSGRRTAIIDTDVGQSDVGPPTTIGLSLPEKPFADYGLLPLTDAYFVGDKSPAGHLLPMVVGTKKMIDEALNFEADFVLVNTTGLVHGGLAHALKRFKFEIVKPEVVIGLERDEEIEHLLRLFEGSSEVIRAEVPIAVRAKSRGERVRFRRIKLASYFRGARREEIDLGRVRVLNGLYGVEVIDVGLTSHLKSVFGREPDAMLYDGEILTVFFERLSSRREVNRFPYEPYGEVRVVDLSHYKGLLLALYDRDDRFLGLGVLERLDLKRNKLVLRTNAGRLEDLASIHLGYILLDEELNERSRMRPGSGLV